MRHMCVCVNLELQPLCAFHIHILIITFVLAVDDAAGAERMSVGKKPQV